MKKEDLLRAYESQRARPKLKEEDEDSDVSVFSADSIVNSIMQDEDKAQVSETEDDTGLDDLDLDPLDLLDEDIDLFEDEEI